MLTDKDKAALRAHNASEKSTAITQQIDRIHRAVNDGTLDRDAVNDALERLTELTGVTNKPDSFNTFTGQQDSFGNSPQSVSSPPNPSPQVTGQPDPHPNPNAPRQNQNPNDPRNQNNTNPNDPRNPNAPRPFNP